MHHCILFFLRKGRSARRHGNFFHAVDGSVKLGFEEFTVGEMVFVV